MDTCDVEKFRDSLDDFIDLVYRDIKDIEYSYTYRTKLITELERLTSLRVDLDREPFA